MRAVVLKAHGGTENLHFVHDHPMPRAMPGEVVLRVRAVALNHHDLFTRRGMEGIRIPLPVITGSDIAGELSAIGLGVADWRVGDRVLVDPECARDGRRGLIGEMWDGGKAEYVAVPATALMRLPQSVSFESAAALPIAYGTAQRMVAVRGRVKAGEVVLVLGASGGLGIATVQLCRMLGASVIACAGSDEKARRLEALGAEHVVNYRDGFREAVQKIVGKPRINGSGGVDVAFNFTGGDTLVDTQRCVRLRGRIVTCGATAGYDATIDMRYWWTFEHEMIGSNGWTREDLTGLVERVAAKELNPVVGHAYPLERAAEAERLLEDREAFGKVVLVP